jgi:hypothetical protein
LTIAILVRVEGGLTAAGFARTCNQFDGLVRGYANATEKLLVKVDQFGPVLALSVGNEHGADGLLYGVCFPRIRARRPRAREVACPSGIFRCRRGSPCRAA